MNSKKETEKIEKFIQQLDNFIKFEEKDINIKNFLYLNKTKNNEERKHKLTKLKNEIVNMKNQNIDKRLLLLRISEYKFLNYSYKGYRSELTTMGINMLLELTKIIIIGASIILATSLLKLEIKDANIISIVVAITSKKITNSSVVLIVFGIIFIYFFTSLKFAVPGKKEEIEKDTVEYIENLIEIIYEKKS